MGYFARIAEQSGIRLAGPRAPRSAIAAHAQRDPEPLDVEDIVLVEPIVEPQPVRAEPQAGPNAELEDSRPAQHAAQPSDAVAPVHPHEVLAARAEQSAPESRATGKPAPSVAPSSGVPASEAGLQVLRSSTPRIAHDAPAFGVSTGPAVQIDEPAGRPEADAGAAHADARQPHGYFARTAEFVAGRGADPIEMHTVILREVQEWVAAAPEAAPELYEVSSEVPPPAGREEVTPPPPDPGVVRIAPAARLRPRPTAAAAPAIEEHRLDLSIGTINVILEGEERPQRPAAAAPERSAERPPRPQPARSGSRLGRHYL